jgi:glycosyltransferase involved in cell wall biosynthesis
LAHGFGIYLGASERSEGRLVGSDPATLAGALRLTGYRLEAEVAALLASCDLICLPSLECPKPSGLALLEAMRDATRLVVCDVPSSGAPWLVRWVRNGILTPPERIKPWLGPYRQAG